VAAVAVMPDPRLFEELGSLRLRRDDVEGAVAALDQALAVAPEYDEARLQRAALRMKFNVSGAREDLDHVLSREPRHVSALMLRADLLVGEGNRTAAEADLRQVLTLAPPDSELAALARKALAALTAPR
jgi:Tfp pilus assembly protein PilF